MHARTGLEPPDSDAGTVILVHGMVVSSRYMMPAAEFFASFCRVYAVDLPGYGKSDKPSRILSLTELAESLADWMDAMEIERAHFAGNSAGCQILAEFALRHPGRVDRLVFQGPVVDPEARSFGRQLARFFLTALYDDISMGWIMLVDYLQAGFRRSLATIKMVLQDRIEERLPRIEAPTLVLWGSRDYLVPRQWAEKATALLPRGESREIPGAAHALNYAAPLKFVKVAGAFLFNGSK